MSEPIIVDDFSNSYDEDEELLTVALTGENGEKFEVTMDKEMAADFVHELQALLGLDEADGDYD